MDARTTLQAVALLDQDDAMSKDKNVAALCDELAQLHFQEDEMKMEEEELLSQVLEKEEELKLEVENAKALMEGAEHDAALTKKLEEELESLQRNLRKLNSVHARLRMKVCEQAELAERIEQAGTVQDDKRMALAKNTEKARVDLHEVESMVQGMEDMGAKVAQVLHLCAALDKHNTTSPSFNALVKDHLKAIQEEASEQLGPGNNCRSFSQERLRQAEEEYQKATLEHERLVKTRERALGTLQKFRAKLVPLVTEAKMSRKL